MIYDVLIIGGGITGCMTAYKLSRYRLRVALVEQGEDVASGASRANSAIVHAGFDPEPGTVKAKLNADGCRQMPAIAQALDVAYQNIGSLVLAFSQEETQRLSALLARGKANGVPQLRLIDQAELRMLEPHVSPRALSALLAPTAGIICSYGLTIAAAESAATNGTDFYFEFPVRAITRSADGVFSITDHRHTLQARYLVNAAGSHADDIAMLAGEPDFPAKSLCRKGEYVLLDKAMGTYVRHTLFSLPGPLGKGVLVSPTVDGNLLVGPNATPAEKEDTSVSAAGIAEVLRGGARLVQELDSRSPVTEFAGVRPGTVLGDFYLHSSERLPGLIHLAGIESPGLASSPAVADEAIRLLQEAGLKPTERSDWNPGRPPVIRFRELPDDEKNELIRRDPRYGKIVCRCETITEGEILDAIHRPLGARSLDMVKRRVRAGMGRCQGGFCSPRVARLLAEELRLPLDSITKSGGESRLLTGGAR